jgi:sigma-B regulation protein RsbU (phosphoserine phosphatase)
MAETRAYVRSYANVESNVGSLLTAVNRRLAEDLDERQFVTLFLARLAPGNHSLQFAGAGHLPCYLLSPEGEVRSVLNSSGPPAGLFTEAQFTSSESNSLEEGDALLFLTDGVTEAVNRDDIEFGVERALEFVRLYRRNTAAEIVAGICEAVSRHMGETMQRDDITCAFVRVRPDGMMG